MCTLVLKETLTYYVNNITKRTLGLEQQQTEPGLVAFHDIRPGNRAGLFLQPWSPHGASPMPNGQTATPQFCPVNVLPGQHKLDIAMHV